MFGFDKYGRINRPEPFKIFRDSEGWKSRGHDWEKQKFYFNDVPADDPVQAMGYLAEMMFGRNKNVR